MDVKTGGIAGILFGGLGLSMSTNQILEIMSIISIGLSIIVTISPLIVSLFKKVKEALKDGKITKEEAEDIKKDVKEITNTVKDKINKEGK